MNDTEMTQFARKMVKVNGKVKALTVGLGIKLTDDGCFSAMGECRFNGNSCAGQCLNTMKGILDENGIVCDKLDAILKF